MEKQDLEKHWWIYTSDNRILFLYAGDIAYVDEEGYIFIVDRKKELIKYKGFQVEQKSL